jgi:hypothetical protein
MLRVFREVQRIRNWEDGARSMVALSVSNHREYEEASITDYIDIYIRMVVQLDYRDIPLIPIHPRPCALFSTMVLRNSRTSYERQ